MPNTLSNTPNKAMNFEKRVSVFVCMAGSGRFLYFNIGRLGIGGLGFLNHRLNPDLSRLKPRPKQSATIKRIAKRTVQIIASG
jgi:hypothetical protein